MCDVLFFVVFKLHAFPSLDDIPTSVFSPFLTPSVFGFSSFLPVSLSMAVWDLSVTVEDLGPDALPITVSVTSDLHVGGVLLKLVEKTRRLQL